MGGTVKDTLVILGVFGVLIGTYLGFRKDIKEKQAQIQQQVAITSKAFSPQTMKNKPFSKLGDLTHESSNYRRREQKRPTGSSKGTSGQATEAYQLPDLYETEELGDRLSVEEGSVEDLASSEQLEDAPVIAGVPVAAWVKSNQNQLKSATITPQSEQHLRVFLGCLELKKNPRAVDKNSCEKFLIAKDSKLVAERERY